MKKQIQQIVSKHINSALIDISPLTGGEAASVFNIRTDSEELCLKLYPFDENKSESGMESKLMKELGKMGIGVPRPLFSGKLVINEGDEREYLIMSFEKGMLLSEKWPSLDKRQKESYLRSLLEMLDRISHVKVSDYGPLDQNLRGLCSSPSLYMQHEIEKLEKSEAFSQVKKTVYDRAKKRLLDFSPSLIKPGYVHADFRLRNIIAKGNDLVLIDFANSMSMDPTFDFVRFILTDFSNEGELNDEGRFLEKLYLRDYYKGSNYENDKSFYLLLLSFRLIPWFHYAKEKSLLEFYLRLMEDHSG